MNYNEFLEFLNSEIKKASSEINLDKFLYADLVRYYDEFLRTNSFARILMEVKQKFYELKITFEFVVCLSGDESVGIHSQTLEGIVLKNPGFPDEDFIEASKKTLKELYDDSTKVVVYTKEEYNLLLSSWEKEMENLNERG